MTDERRYTPIENTLQIINREYVSLSPDDMRSHNEMLHEVLDFLIDKCKNQNPLFRELYRNELLYGGSYYDGLKIRCPDEYDIDIPLHLPYEGPILPSNSNGFVNLNLTPNYDHRLWNRRLRCPRPYYGIHGLHALINSDHYLDTDKVMLWMHQILSTSLGGKKRNKVRIIETDICKIKFQRKGPAFTFRVAYYNGIIINLDLVVCFVFGENQWPLHGFRLNPVPEKPEFLIVPKPLEDDNIGTRYWRLSFQERERVLLNDRGRLKPTLRLIKKMRDKMNLKCIASYYIKTVLLWKVYVWRRNDTDFWNKSLAHVFMTVLRDFQGCINRGRIEYFWYRKLNLLKDVDRKILQNISRRLEKIIINIEKNPVNKFLVAKYLLTRRELKDFIQNYGEELV